MIASFVKGFASFLGRHIRGGRLCLSPPFLLLLLPPPISRDIQPTNGHKSHPPTLLLLASKQPSNDMASMFNFFFHIDKGEIFDYLITEWWLDRWVCLGTNWSLACAPSLILKKRLGSPTQLLKLIYYSTSSTQHHIHIYFIISNLWPVNCKTYTIVYVFEHFFNGRKNFLNKMIYGDVMLVINNPVLKFLRLPYSHFFCTHEFSSLSLTNREIKLIAIWN